jgi:putative transposase
MADEGFLRQIRVFYRRSTGCYGSPRIHADFKRNSIPIGRKRVARLMRCNGLVAKKARPTWKPTKASYPYQAADNVLGGNFYPALLNKAWVSDITYISTAQGWLYLATVMDLCSRRIVGWAMSSYINADLVIRALQMAVASRNPAPGLIVHSDQGSQYGSRAYRAVAEEHGIVRSMSRKGCCWDNAVAESFFATMKIELQSPVIWASRDEARSYIFEYIEGWYNPRRFHSTNGYLSPMEYEECQIVV